MIDDSIEYYVDKHGDKIKKIMSDKLDFSFRLIKKLEEEGNIYLNGKKVSSNKNTYIDDILRIEFSDEKNIYEENKMKLNILFENQDFLAVNKPPYMLVHPSKVERKDTLANGIVGYYKEKNIKRKIRFINRLDMNTSGVVLIAKNSYAQSRIMTQMNENKILKKYTALIKGPLEDSEGVIDKPIGLEKNENIKRSVIEKGKYSITRYKLIKNYENEITLIELMLETGRTHQIRVHMNYIGHPLIGDELYGEKSKLLERQALHCSEIGFKNIRNDEYINVKAPLPEDFLKVMEGIR